MRHLRFPSLSLPIRLRTAMTILVIGMAAGLASAQMALAQAGSSWGSNRAGGGVSSGGARPAPARTAVRPTPGPAGTRTGDAGFAQRLGTTVGSPGFAPRVGARVALPPSPGVALPPGVGNINRPGTAPAVLPGFWRPPTANQGIPNINSPAGVAVSRPDGRSHFDGRRNVHSGRVGGVIVYGVPYAVPYYAPYAEYPPESSAEVVPDGSTTSVYGGSYIVPPTEPGVTSFPEGGQGTMQGSVDDSQAHSTTQNSEPNGQQLQTLLVLKDHTLLLVTNYWLDGDSLTYYLGDGEEGSVQISQLDFSLTQQLNRERNVPFVLQSRP